MNKKETINELVKQLTKEECFVLFAYFLRSYRHFGFSDADIWDMFGRYFIGINRFRNV